MPKITIYVVKLCANNFDINLSAYTNEDDARKEVARLSDIITKPVITEDEYNHYLFEVGIDDWDSEKAFFKIIEKYPNLKIEDLKCAKNMYENFLAQDFYYYEPVTLYGNIIK